VITVAECSTEVASWRICRFLRNNPLAKLDFGGTKAATLVSCHRVKTSAEVKPT